MVGAVLLVSHGSLKQLLLAGAQAGLEIQERLSYMSGFLVLLHVISLHMVSLLPGPLHGLSLPSREPGLLIHDCWLSRMTFTEIESKTF